MRAFLRYLHGIAFRREFLRRRDCERSVAAVDAMIETASGRGPRASGLRRSRWLQE